jgi:hypothetical protein
MHFPTSWPHRLRALTYLLWRWRTSDVANVTALLDAGQRAPDPRLANIEIATATLLQEDLIPDRLQDAPACTMISSSRFGSGRLVNERHPHSAINNRTSWYSGVGGHGGASARWHMREGNIAVAYFAAQHFIQPDEG